MWRKLGGRGRWVGLLAALLATAVFLARTFDLDVSGGSVPEGRDLPRYSAREAADHIGERARVCGRVASTAYVPRVRGRPTFLNLGRPYPDQPFTVVIWGRNREKFGEPETRYRNREICVAGGIREHRGTPQIEASDPVQIEVRDGPR